MSAFTEQFKAEFLKYCAVQGLSEDEALAQVEGASQLLKSADVASWIPGWDVMTHGAKQMINAAKDVGTFGLKATGAGLLLAPLAVGALAGRSMASAGGSLSDQDIDEVKKRELIDEYQRARRSVDESNARARRRLANQARPARSILS